MLQYIYICVCVFLQLPETGINVFANTLHTHLAGTLPINVDTGCTITDYSYNYA